MYYIDGLIRVINLKNEPRAESQGAVRIDRSTKWGNPFVIGRDGTRVEVVRRYRADLWRRIQAGEIPLEDLAALHGKILACWCEPELCHGIPLAGAAQWAAMELNVREHGHTCYGVTFKRVNPRHSRIYVDGESIGDVYRQRDALKPSEHYYVIHLIDDWRGPQYVHERHRIRKVAEHLVDTYPYG